MSIFRYLFFLGISQLVFEFLWKLVILGATLIFTLLKIFGPGIYFMKGLGYFLLVTLTAALTMTVISENPTIGSVILYSLTGGFVILINLSGGMYEGRKEASMQNNYEALTIMRYDGFYLLGALILFVLSLLVPPLAVNPITQWFWSLVYWLYHLKVIGWLLGIGGVLFMISIVFRALLMVGVISFSLTQWLKSHFQSNPKSTELGA